MFGPRLTIALGRTLSPNPSPAPSCSPSRASRPDCRSHKNGRAEFGPNSHASLKPSRLRKKRLVQPTRKRWTGQSIKRWFAETLPKAWGWVIFEQKPKSTQPWFEYWSHRNIAKYGIQQGISSDVSHPLRSDSVAKWQSWYYFERGALWSGRWTSWSRVEERVNRQWPPREWPDETEMRSLGPKLI